MTSYVTPKKNSAFIFYVSLVSQADRPLFQNDPTLAAGDVKIAKDGGAFQNLTTLPSGTQAGTALVGVDVTATEMNADNIAILFVDAAGAEWDDLGVFIQTTANQIDDLATATALATAQADLDNPNQYKADVSGLATSGSVSGLNALLTGVNGLAVIVSDLGDVHDDVDDTLLIVGTRLPAALVSGRIDAAVGWMATGTITAAAVADGAIDAGAIADGAIDAATFAAGAIDAAAIKDGAIDAATFTAGAIDAAAIKDGAIDAATFAAGAIDAAAIKDGAIDAATFAAGAIDAAAIKDGAIDAATFAAGAIDAAAIKDGAIDAATFAAGAIDAAAIKDGAIDAATFAAGAITAAVIATGAIDADAIADNAIDAGAIAADAITAAKIADAAIDAATFAAGAITAAGIATGAIDADALAHDAVEEISEDVWDHSHRTLTTAAAAIAAAVLGTSITVKRGDTLSLAVTGLGSLAGRTKFWFTVKADHGEPDTAALILIRETDGLIYLNGAAAAAGQGSLVVTSVPLGNVTVTLVAAATATLLDGDYTYDFQILTPTGVTTLSEGTFTVTADITWAIA